MTISSNQTSVTLYSWIPSSDTWTYSSADAPTYIFTISGDQTNKYWVGMKLKYTQDSTVKYAIITAITYSAPNTLVTIYGGGNTSSPSYAMTSSTITNTYYSVAKCPQGFPLNPDTWSYIITDTSQRTLVPSGTTWYNLGNISISIPIGIWNVSYQVCALDNRSPAAPCNVYCTLSTTNNGETDAQFTVLGVASSIVEADFTFFRQKVLSITVKTPYYINTKSGSSGSAGIYNQNHISPLIIKAVCIYL